MPFPDYKDILEGRERVKRQEIEGGRQRVLKNMAEGLVERLKKDYRMEGLMLDTGNSDPRKWVIVVTEEGLPPMEESFWDFPSHQMIANLMLLGKIKNDA